MNVFCVQMKSGFHCKTEDAEKPKTEGEQYILKRMADQTLPTLSCSVITIWSCIGNRLKTIGNCL